MGKYAFMLLTIFFLSCSILEDSIEKLYSVKYMNNEADGGSVPIDNNSYLSGDEVVILSNSGSLIRDGYTFMGWSETEGSETAISGSLTVGSTDITLYPVWSLIPTYSVTYLDTDADSGDVPVDSTNYISGDSVTLLSNDSLVRDGYTFMGWSETEGSETAISGSLTIGSIDITLYPVWSLIPTYSVTYLNTDADSGDVPVDNTSYISGDSVTLLSNDSLVRDGYDFIGWSETEGSETAISGSLTIGSIDITLYPVWSLIPTYSVTYLNTDADSGDVPVDSTNYISGDSVTLLSNDSLVRDGYDFIGWSETEGSETAISGSLTVGSTDITLYPVWSLIPTYSVTYLDTDADSGDVPVDSTNYISGDSVTLLSNDSLVRDSYNFMGWSETEGSETAISGSLTVGNTDITLYPVWSLVPTYSVTYLGTDADSGDVPVDSRNYISGESVTLLSNDSLVRDGYNFMGWSETEGSETAISGSLTVGSTDITLYPVWSLIPTYSVTYLNTDADSGDVPVDNTSYISGDSVTLLSNDSLVRDGYDFIGWSETEGSETVISGSLTVGSTDITLYPVWSLIPTYSVTYLGTEADSGDVPVDSTNYISGDSVTLLSNDSLVRDGYDFIGWSETEGSETAISGSLTVGSTDITLYPVWSLIPTYSVTYLDTDADSGDVPVDSTNYISGDSVTLLSNDSLVRDGYDFIGWSETEGSETAISGSLTVGSTDITLYPVWSLIPTYSITYLDTDADSGDVPVDNTSYISGDISIILTNSGSLAREGYSFIGWKSSIDETILYDCVSSIEIYSDITLEPNWIATPEPTDMVLITIPETGISFPRGTTNTYTATVDHSFEVGKTEVTYELWETVRNWATTDNGSGFRVDGGELYSFRDGFSGANDNNTENSDKQHPVVMITWPTAIVFCNAVTEYYNYINSTSYEPVYTTDSEFLIPLRSTDSDNNYYWDYDYINGDGSPEAPYVNSTADGYRLPSYYEWELAAKWYGQDAEGRTDLVAGSDNIDWTDGYYWYPGNYPSGGFTHFNDSSDTTPENAIIDGKDSLDMVGNYMYYYDGSTKILSDTYLGSTSLVGSYLPNKLGLFDMSGNVMEFCFDYKLSGSLLYRAVRGGCWEYESNLMQSGYNYYYLDDGKLGTLGLRLFRTVK